MTAQTRRRITTVVLAPAAALAAWRLIRLAGIAEDQEHRLGFRRLLTERQRYERLMSEARDRLGPAYESEHRAGAALTLEDAVAEARLHAPT